MSRPRGFVVVTGSELVRGDRHDLNGPFLASELLRLGVEPARISIVGDDPVELEAALREGLEADLCCVSGGLGPTHDDRTVELVARASGRELFVDEALAAEIESISRAIAERLGRPYADFEQGVRKQATVVEGAIVVGIAGTAPALVLESGRGTVVVLPGPPSELRRLWPSALESEPVRQVLSRAREPERRVLRFYGASESEIARALEESGGEGDGVTATICAREFEIHVDLFVEEGAGARADELAEGLRERAGRHLFVEDERPVEALVLDACRERGLTLATAESCTGGLVAARLTSVPGSSDVFLGAVVAYADGVKARELAVPPEMLERYGAVSAEAAAAMAEGARARLGADVAVAVTGVAGPGGGTPEKPVGLVYLHAAGHDGSLARRLDLPGDRQAIRARSTVAALHLVRMLLARSRDDSV
ncbi:MAG TPA: CinA family nicotinamide mononucleotide deamidase-related protein [Gaiellaceae bacterium]|nr:CinA family nicotinamide mononucleotide deamidase-related protein [Gaiellaceae bacterium]